MNISPKSLEVLLALAEAPKLQPLTFWYSPESLQAQTEEQLVLHSMELMGSEASVSQQKTPV